nr:hypothetical protein [Tanacetum cinerariifolium]
MPYTIARAICMHDYDMLPPSHGEGRYISTAATTVTITTKEITLAQALKALKTSKPNVKGIVSQEPDEEEVTFDAILLAVKSSRIVDWKIHKEGKKSYYQIVRADRKSQMYMIFSQMLKSFNREDLEDLYKLLTTSCLIDGLSFDWIDMVIKDLDLCQRSMPCPSEWKEMSKKTSSKILPGGNGSCGKTFKPIASLITKGKLK